MNYHSHVFSDSKFNLQTLNTLMKPFNLLNLDIVKKEKGTLNKTFTRFIGPGDSVFSMFFRSYGYKIHVPLTELHSIPFNFIIYDKNEKHIKMFQRMLEWDGNGNNDLTKEADGLGWKEFTDFLEQAKKDLDIDINDFHMDHTIGKASRRGFADFKESWNHFRNSKFTFINICLLYTSDAADE